MKTFTLKDLDRQPAAVLDACDRDGEVRIRRGKKRAYTVRPAAAALPVHAATVPSPAIEPEDSPATPAAGPRTKWRRLLQEHYARMQRVFPEPVSPAQLRELDRLIAGE